MPGGGHTAQHMAEPGELKPGKQSKDTGPAHGLCEESRAAVVGGQCLTDEWQVHTLSLAFVSLCLSLS